MRPLRATTGETVLPLTEGWSLAVTAAGACAGPAEAAALTDWLPAVVPGTVALALERAGCWRRESPWPLNDKDVWYRAPAPGSGPHRLRFEGLATIAEVWVDAQRVLTSDSMFQPHEVEADLPRGATLWLCFRALAPRLQAKGPRARWRPRMIDAQGLRLVRTTLLGHMPGWTPPIDVVGPWRPVSLIAPGPLSLREARIRTDWSEAGGARLEVSVALAGAREPPLLDCAGASVAMTDEGDGRFSVSLRVPDAEPWWPHTHGAQPLYAVRLRFGEAEIDLGRTGFRRIEADGGVDGRGFRLKVNGEPVFCRGACWITPDLVGLGGDRGDYEPTLELARQAGMNMLRVAGVGVYETRAFFELCDELGLLVWQDFMFANFDYPAGDPGFVEAVRREAEAFLAGVQGSPALAVLCGGSEVTQQAAMMGLAVGELDWPLFDQVLAEAAAALRPDVPYLPNTPYGGPLPFAANEGVSHYYGVGAYERPPEDARRAEVRFAAECLGLANVPERATLAKAQPALALTDARWKARTPRDRGAAWDFEDVRDHYLAARFAVDPPRLRREEPELYLDLSRAVSGEVMAAVFGEWRRAGSACAGGLVWFLRDLQVGAGWGLIDAAGEPKPVWHAVRRVLRPVQALITDEGVNGLSIHLLNETARPVAAELRLAVFGESGAPALDVRRPVELAPRSGQALSAFDLIGRFFDVSYAYRFGPRRHEAVAAQLLDPETGALIAEAIHMLGPRSGLPCGDVTVGLEVGASGWRLVLLSPTLQRIVQVADPAFRADEDWFPLLPGEPRRVRLVRREHAPASATPEGEILTPGGGLAGSYARP